MSGPLGIKKHYWHWQEKTFRLATSHIAFIENPETIYHSGAFQWMRKGVTTWHMLLSGSWVFHFHSDIIDDNILRLLELDVMQRHGQMHYFHKNKMRSSHYPWTLVLQYYRVHSFMELPKVGIFLTKPEPTRTHLHYLHPSPGNLFRLLEITDPGKRYIECKKTA